MIFRLEPYRAHFLLGSCAAILGLFPWILFSLGAISFYPAQLHSAIMIPGFLFCYVCGFLMTAVPRMTGTPPASMAENLASLGCAVALLVLAFLGQNTLAWAAAAAQFIFLAFFFSRRAIQVRGGLPRGFIFIPMGLAMGLIGVLVSLFGSHLGPDILRLGRLLLFEGFLLNLIVGLGSRLVPVLTRKSTAQTPASVSMAPNHVIWLEALFLNGSFFVEVFVSPVLGHFFRFAVLGFVVFYNFYLHKPASETSFLGRGVSVAVASIPLAYLFMIWLPGYRTHLIHILFVTGFSLLTLLVSTRVTLAHGGEALEHEKSSKPLLAVIAMLLLASGIRAAGPILFTEKLIPIIFWASALMVGGIIYWLANFGRLLWQAK